ncbi:MAG: hypothetical protein CME93_06845 [Hyphomonadaceae bacterium]|nr:hypothetical protein [Hyphomonadaceae bacterium]OUX93668.1 MAG: hypothetical protein CBB77_08320 [Hyphomonas sp. TMED17]
MLDSLLSPNDVSAFAIIIKRCPMTKTAFIPSLLIGLFLTQTTAFTQTPADFIACKSVIDPGERLACFDAAAAGLVADDLQTVPATSADNFQAAPATSGSSQTMASNAAPSNTGGNAAEANGGLLPSWFPRARNNAPSSQSAVDEPDRYVTKVVEIERNNIGRYFFTTEEGFVWRQLELRPIRVPRTLPTEVEIRQGALGSTRLKLLATGRSYSVSRVE